jgi:uncharacterized protein YdaU (DUF1376 family)
MSEAKYPAYQHYAKDFLAGTADMSCAERGAYITLLDQAWDQSPVATLPDSDEKLRRFAGADPDEWLKVKTSVLAKFTKDDRFPGRIVNDRLRAYYEELREHHEEMSERGKKGAAARHKTKPVPDAEREAERDDNRAALKLRNGYQ